MNARKILLWTILGFLGLAVLGAVAFIAVFVYQLVTGPSLIT